MRPVCDPVDERLLEPFLAYCARHGRSHDESFVPGPGFRPGGDTPAFVLLEKGEVRGAAALMLGAGWGRSGRGRFSILHAGGDVQGSAEEYAALIQAAAGAARGRVGELALYLPEDLATTRARLEGLGFGLERIVWGMAAPIDPRRGTELPAGFRLEAIGRDDEAAIADFTAVRNRNFKEVLGSHDIGPGDARALFDAPERIDGGVLLLRDPGGAPVGTAYAERDSEEGTLFVGTISVDRASRGRGLGRALLRAAIDAGRRAGLRRAFLSVNAVNRNALRLYESEGFALERAMACLVAPLGALESSSGGGAPGSEPG